MTTATSPFRRQLSRFEQRARLRAALVGAAASLAALVVVSVLFLLGGAPIGRGVEVAVGVVAIVIGSIIGLIVRRRRSTAAEIEQRSPALRNIVLTSAELDAGTLDVRPALRTAIIDQATTALAGIETASLLPLSRQVMVMAFLVVVWLGTAAAAGRAPRHPNRPTLTATTIPALSRVTVTVIPPAYARQPTTQLVDPSRIDVLAGSSVRLDVDATATSLSIETLEGSRQTTSSTGRFTDSLLVGADGFIAVEPRIGDRRGPRRLIGVGTTPDRPPRVSITVPAKDLFFSDGNRSIDLAIEADDDLGLSSLALRYTKVSGSGERFTFVEDTLPVVVHRRDERHWSARSTLRLDALHLEPGDVVVYRAQARDRRPGGAPSESDSWIVEITAPGMTAAEGFSMDDMENKYALSQQMVILKTQRLIAQAPSVTSDSVATTAMLIAAEQRAVRAEFVFMMGGEVAEDVVAAAGMTDLNEQAEAAAEVDIAAGRLQNQGRQALVQSIRFMSRANTSLISCDLSKALGEEKAALTLLQQAFSRTRYLLRALTQRERLDLARRLTGTLTLAASDIAAPPAGETDTALVALRRILADVATLAGARPEGASNRYSELAQRVIALSPSDRGYQSASTLLAAAGTAAARRDIGDAQQAVDSATTILASILRRSSGVEPSSTPSLDLAILRRAMSSAAVTRRR